MGKGISIGVDGNIAKYFNGSTTFLKLGEDQAQQLVRKLFNLRDAYSPPAQTADTALANVRVDESVDVEACTVARKSVHKVWGSGVISHNLHTRDVGVTAWELKENGTRSLVTADIDVIDEFSVLVKLSPGLGNRRYLVVLVG